MRKTLFLSLAGLALSSLSHAGSFQINLQGIRQTAMGGTGVAMPWDISTVFFNPAGLSRLNGMEAYGSVFLVSPNIRYVPANGGTTYYEPEKQSSTPFAVYVGGTLKKMPKLGIGLGVYTPFGSSINWGNDWVGSLITQSISLKSIFIQPTISYAITDRISIGAGFVYGTGSVNIQRALPLQFPDGRSGQLTLDGNAHGFGFNAGVQVRATDKLDLGISFRSGVNMKVDDGTATFNAPAGVSPLFPTGNTFKTNLQLPNITTVGASYRFTPDFTLQADVVFAGWKAYDSLKFDFAKNTSAVADNSSPRMYKNTVAFRLGGHYKINSKFAVMAGGAWDPTPSDDQYVSPDAVDADRLSLSAGLTYEPVRNLNIMAVVNYTTTAGREVSYAPENFSGKYQIKSVSPGIGVSYKF